MTPGAVIAALPGDEQQVNAKLDGWQAWCVPVYAGPDAWSARPHGALVAVISGMPSAAALVSAVKAYERRIPAMLAEARARLADIEAQGGCDAPDRIAVVQALVTALEMRKPAT